MREESKKSRSEKRNATSMQGRLASDLTSDISRQELHKLQDEDQVIQGCRKRNPHLLVDRNGLWYHLWTPKHSKETIE